MEYEGKHTEKSQRWRQAHTAGNQRLPESIVVRGSRWMRDSSYKAQMVEFERCIGPWVEETFASILVRRFADERDFTDNRLEFLLSP